MSGVRDGGFTALRGGGGGEIVPRDVKTMSLYVYLSHLVPAADRASACEQQQPSIVAVVFLSATCTKAQTRRWER